MAISTVLQCYVADEEMFEPADRFARWARDDPPTLPRRDRNLPATPPLCLCLCHCLCLCLFFRLCLCLCLCL